jgi:hypothetical protein
LSLNLAGLYLHNTAVNHLALILSRKNFFKEPCLDFNKSERGFSFMGVRNLVSRQVS